MFQTSKHTRLKLRLVYLPFLLTLCLTIIVYGIIRWTLDFQTGILNLKKEVWEFIIPAGLTILIILLWIRKRLFILNLTLSPDQDSYHDLFQLLMGFMIGVTIFTSQSLLEASSFGLKKISRVQEVKKYPLEKYFSLKGHIADFTTQSIYTTAKISDNEEKETLDFEVYVVCLFLEFEKETLVDPDSNSLIWYARKFTKSIDNDLSQEAKTKVFRQLVDSASNVVKQTSMDTVPYFRKTVHSYDKDGYAKAVQKGYPNLNTQAHIFLSPEQGKFASRHTNALLNFLLALGVTLVGVACMVFIPKIDTQALKDYQAKSPSEHDEFKEVLDSINPLGEFKFIAIIFWINVLVYVVMILLGVHFLSPTADVLLRYGGVSRPTVLSGEYWRLLTSNFIHSGAMHLMLNIYALILVSTFLRDYLKTFQLLLFYLICGVYASITSIYWHSDTVSVGASGAIFGLVGILFILHIFQKLHADDEKAAGAWFALLPLGLCFLLGLGSAGIDNAAHIGGLLSGVIFGISILLFKIFRKPSTRIQ